MRRLTPSGRRDRGTIAVLVSILFSSGVLLGCAALTIDVGNIDAERRQLQNGADAVALSAAQDCAKQQCPTSGSASLSALANANSSDGVSSISRVDASLPAVCGVGLGLVTCPAATGTLGDCVAPAGGLAGKYVKVYARTMRPGGSTVLPYHFGQLLAGGSSGGTQQSCAAASWGPPRSGTPIIPFTVSSCEWYQATHNGTVYATSPTYDATNPMTANNPLETALALNSASTAPCSSWAGHDYPGGFGWLVHGNSCQVDVTSGSWVQGDTGVGAGNDCGSNISARLGTVVYLPVFDCADDNRRRLPCAGNLPSGTDSWYHVKGFAAMYLTGVDVTGPVTGHLPGHPTSAAAASCQAKGGKCVYGWFLKGLVDPSALVDPAGTDFGLNAVQLVG